MCVCTKWSTGHLIYRRYAYSTTSQTRASYSALGIAEVMDESRVHFLCALACWFNRLRISGRRAYLYKVSGVCTGAAPQYTFEKSQLSKCVDACCMCRAHAILPFQCGILDLFVAPTAVIVTVSLHWDRSYSIHPRLARTKL